MSSKGLPCSSPQKARLQGAGIARAGSAIMTFGGVVTGEGDDLKTTPSISMSPKLTNMFKDAPKDEPKDASEGNGTPGGAKLGRSASATVVATPAPPKAKRSATEPALFTQEVSEKEQIDTGLPSHTEEVPQDEGPKISISPVQFLPNLADGQFDSPRNEVPMPENIKHFTQDQWDELVGSLTNFRSYISALTVAGNTLTVP
jgi:hypothetical protein